MTGPFSIVEAMNGFVVGSTMRQLPHEKGDTFVQTIGDRDSFPDEGMSGVYVLRQ